jgi:hypothetical protein
MAFAMAPGAASAQTPANDVSRTASKTAMLPGISFGAGISSVGTEGTPWNTPWLASMRFEITRYLVADVEWTQPMRASTSSDSGDVGLMTLNGQQGIYGRVTHQMDQELRTFTVGLLVKSRLGRVSFLAGGGVAKYEWSSSSVYTRTGCTGPWVVACQSGNGRSAQERKGSAPVFLGGFDVNVHPRVSVFASGRIGGWNGIEEAAVSTGVRASLVPDRVYRRGGSRSDSPLKGVAPGDKIWITRDDGAEESATLMAASASDITYRSAGRVVTTPFSAIKSIKASDSLLEGLLIGASSGVALGFVLASYDEPRNVPASILIGAGVGAFLDALGSKRRVVYQKRTSVAVVPVVTPAGARMGVNIAWR